MLDEELAKNKGKMSFYVLADIRDKFNPSLIDKSPAWTMFLEFEDKTKVSPVSITEIVEEIDPEILTLFDCCYKKPKFKVPYLVEFNVNSKYTTSGKPFKMVLNSVERSCELGWQGGHKALVKPTNRKTKTKGRLRRDEDWYWL